MRRDEVQRIPDSGRDRNDSTLTERVERPLADWPQQGYHRKYKQEENEYCGTARSSAGSLPCHQSRNGSAHVSDKPLRMQAG